MGKLPYFPFYVGDWLRDPGQRMLTLDEKGAWVEILVAMHDGKPRGEITGTIGGLSRLLGVDEEDGYYVIHGLITKGVCDVVFHDGSEGYFHEQFGKEHDPRQGHVPFCPVTVTLISRRMKREEDEREYEREKKRKQRESRSSPKNVPDVSPQCPPVYSYSSSSSNLRKESDISSPDAPLFEEGSDPYDLASFLAELITTNNERAKTPDLSTPAGQKWCKVFDLMIRVDQLDPGEIAAVINWCQSDDFWQTNILSPAKFRKQYARLYAEAKKNGAPMRLVKED